MCVHFDKRKRVAFLLKTSQALEREREEKKWKKRRADRARVRRGTVFQNEAEKRGENQMDDPSSNEALPDSRKRKEGLATRATKAYYEPVISSSSQNTATLFLLKYRTRSSFLILFC